MKPIAVLREGVVAGLYGGAGLILLFFVFDVVRLQPLSTPLVLSSAVLGEPPEAGPELLAALKVGEWILVASRVAAFTALHLVAFAGLGVGAAVLFGPVGLPKHVLTGGLYGATACSLVFYASVGWVGGGEAGAALDARLLLAANAVAGVVMVAHLAGVERAGPD